MLDLIQFAVENDFPLSLPDFCGQVLENKTNDDYVDCD
jgi:hypothetical protein